MPTPKPKRSDRSARQTGATPVASNRTAHSKGPRGRRAATSGPKAIVHEVSLCTAIAKVAHRTAAGQPVERVRVDVGALRQVVPETLRLCWEMVVFDTPLHAVPLEVREVPACIKCRGCGATTELREPVLVCAACGSTDTQVLTGDELDVTSIDVTVT